MKRDEKKLEQRRAYVRKRVMHATYTTKEVKRLADELFLSEKTVWQDLRDN